MNELMIKHAYEYGDKLADVLLSKKLIPHKMGMFLSKSDEGVSLSYYKDNNFNKVVARIDVKDLLNAETSFDEKIEKVVFSDKGDTMEEELKPYMFVRTIVSWGTDEDDARDRLAEVISEYANDISEWSCDEISSEELQQDDSPADFS